eukprot:745615-Hanusia_phi.AAC.4
MEERLSDDFNATAALTEKSAARRNDAACIGGCNRLQRMRTLYRQPQGNACSWETQDPAKRSGEGKEGRNFE